MISRFLRLLSLPDVVQTWTSWQPNESELSLTTAQELARLSGDESQLHMAKLVLQNRLTSKEVGHAVMRTQRAGESVDSAVAAVLKLRPRIHKKFVFIATVTDPQTRIELSKLNQSQRNALLAQALRRLGLDEMKGTLGVTRFTVVADAETAEGHNADALETSIGQSLKVQLA